MYNVTLWCFRVTNMRWEHNKALYVLLLLLLLLLLNSNFTVNYIKIVSVSQQCFLWQIYVAGNSFREKLYSN
jgi:hypothetical protein